MPKSGRARAVLAPVSHPGNRAHRTPMGPGGPAMACGPADFSMDHVYSSSTIDSGPLGARVVGAITRIDEFTLFGTPREHASISPNLPIDFDRPYCGWIVLRHTLDGQDRSSILCRRLEYWLSEVGAILAEFTRSTIRMHLLPSKPSKFPDQTCTARASCTVVPATRRKGYMSIFMPTVQLYKSS